MATTTSQIRAAITFGIFINDHIQLHDFTTRIVIDAVVVAVWMTRTRMAIVVVRHDVLRMLHSHQRHHFHN